MNLCTVLTIPLFFCQLTMLLTLKEIISWTQMSAFELFLHLVSVVVFTVLLALRVEGDLELSWSTVFAPLFICDGLSTYLCLIRFIRMLHQLHVKFQKVGVILIFLLLLYLFFSCKPSDITFSEPTGSVELEY